MTQIYCDIADLKLIKKFNNKKIVKGFTTNPSLMKKAGVATSIVPQHPKPLHSAKKNQMDSPSAPYTVQATHINSPQCIF